MKIIGIMGAAGAGKLGGHADLPVVFLVSWRDYRCAVIDW